MISPTPCTLVYDKLKALFPWNVLWIFMVFWKWIQSCDLNTSGVPFRFHTEVPSSWEKIPSSFHIWYQQNNNEENLQRLNWENGTLSISLHSCCSLRGLYDIIGIGGRNEFPAQKRESVLFQYAQWKYKKFYIPPQKELFEYLQRYLLKPRR